MRIIFCLIALTLTFEMAQSQLVIDTAANPLAAVNNFLLGEGVVTSNVYFDATPAQIGTYSGLENFGLPSGIVLSSGAVNNLLPGNNYTWVDGYNNDFDLLQIANSVPPLINQSFSVTAINDRAALDFDFVPLGSTINFNFIFGSDEYDTWINTPFNDIFAFFVSGPQITGPYWNNAVNIASVPGSNPPLPITVSSINNLLNSELYISNINGIADSMLTVNGYTVPLVASLSGLIPGEVYHITLAIADGSDSALNSYVMLGAGSFTSSTPAFNNESVDFDSDGVIGVGDLIILMNDYGCTDLCAADANSDGSVTVADIQLFIAAFGAIIN